MAPVTGTVVNVVDHQYGSQLDGDHATGATSLTVVWTNDFNADGGQLYFADPDTGDVVETITYTVPHDTDDVPSETEIDLAIPLANDYADATPVYVYPKLVERKCWFIPPDGEEPIVARVPHQLVPFLKLGARDADDAEQIECGGAGTDLVVTDVLARSAVQDLNSVLITTSPDGEDPQTWMDENGLHMSMNSSAGVLAESLDWFNSSLSADDPLAEIVPQFNLSGFNIIGQRLFDNSFADFAGTRFVVHNVFPFSYTVFADAGAESVKVIADDGTSDFELATSDGWQDWSPTLSGWSSNPSGGIYRYRQTGKRVEVAIRQPSTGTSNATTKSITLPVPVASITNMHWSGLAVATDNGTDLATASRAVIQSGSGTIDFAKDLSTNTGGWTAAGSHRIRTASIVYEAA